MTVQPSCTVWNKGGPCLFSWVHPLWVALGSRYGPTTQQAQITASKEVPINKSTWILKPQVFILLIPIRNQDFDIEKWGQSVTPGFVLL